MIKITGENGRWYLDDDDSGFLMEIDRIEKNPNFLFFEYRNGHRGMVSMLGRGDLLKQAEALGLPIVDEIR